MLSRIESRIGGARTLATCSAGSGWPKRGVYFFFEPGETRSGSGTGPRVVRVGTHAVTSTSRTTLWNRLSQHKGTGSLGGNHRGSVFRLLVGSALAAREPSLAVPTWAKKPGSPEIRNAERTLERAVSEYICAMPFIWVEVADDPSPTCRRAYIERNSIALLSGVGAHGAGPADPPSQNWLGKSCPHPDVKPSGLWNSRHVRETYDPAFLDELRRRRS